MPEPELVVAATFAQKIEADLACGALQAAGIESVVSADDAGGQYVGVIGPIRLLVHRDEVLIARQILGLPH